MHVRYRRRSGQVLVGELEVDPRVAIGDAQDQPAAAGGEDRRRFLSADQHCPQPIAVAVGVSGKTKQNDGNEMAESDFHGSSPSEIIVNLHRRGPFALSRKPCQAVAGCR